MVHVCLAFSSSSIRVQSGLSELGTVASSHREKGAVQRGKADTAGGGGERAVLRGLAAAAMSSLFNGGCVLYCPPSWALCTVTLKMAQTAWRRASFKLLSKELTFLGSGAAQVTELHAGVAWIRLHLAGQPFQSL